jgi:hypothetical protein
MSKYFFNPENFSKSKKKPLQCLGGAFATG